MKSEEIIQFYEEKIKLDSLEHTSCFILISYFFSEKDKNLALFFCAEDKEKGILCGGHAEITNIPVLELIKAIEYFQKNNCKIVFDLNYWEKNK